MAKLSQESMDIIGGKDPHGIVQDTPAEEVQEEQDDSTTDETTDEDVSTDETVSDDSAAEDDESSVDSSEDQAETYVEETGEDTEESAEKKKPAADSWIDDQVLEIGQTHLLTRDEIASQFKSREEFDRYSRQVDIFLGKIQSQEIQPQDQYQEQYQKDPLENGQPEKEEPGYKDGKIDVAYYEDPENNYDETTIAFAKQLRASQDQMEALRDDRDYLMRVHAEQQHLNAIKDFHNSLDKLNPEFYGSSLDKDGKYRKFTEEEIARRNEAWVALNGTIIPAIQRQERLSGRQVDVSMDAAVIRAVQLAHSEDLNKFKTNKRAAALKKQSSMRRPKARGSVISSPRPVDSTGDPVEDIVQTIRNDPGFRRSIEKAGSV